MFDGGFFCSLWIGMLWFQILHPSAPHQSPLSDGNPTLLDAVTDSSVVSIETNGLQVIADYSADLTVKLTPSNGVWDCQSKLWMVLDIANNGEGPVLVEGRTASIPDAPLWSQNTGAARILPGETNCLPILISREITTDEEERITDVFGDIVGFPGGHQNTVWKLIDASAVTELYLDFYSNGDDVDCLLSGLRAVGDFSIPSDTDLERLYYPCADRFGQSLNIAWPEKIHRAYELTNCLQTEVAWLDANSQMPDRDQYGGWAGGESFEATGHFYPLKHDGTWWLVDPAGNPFWSFGIVGLNYGLDFTTTPGIWGELNHAPLDEPGSEDLPFLQGDYWNPYVANLYRKYGENWSSKSASMAHRRLHAWGVNTLGNWSTSEFYALQETPYTVAVRYRRYVMSGEFVNGGGELPDVFHPEFRSCIFGRMQEETLTADDSWCIGYFIDNELDLLNALTPGEVALSAPETCYTRNVLIANLQTKYGTVSNLNVAWGTAFGLWDELAIPIEKKNLSYKADMREFNEVYLREYYSTCRDAVRSETPNKLYLGSRIDKVSNDALISICAEYADVVSVNYYDYTPDFINLPLDFDAPVLIGEFHFGTLERGMWGAGLKTGIDGSHAANLMRGYLRDALEHPMIVGAHWFKFSDQPITGRPDGENYRIGFVDVTDTPYSKLVDSARMVSSNMYLWRSGL